jgi:cation transport protein ChaC
VKAIEAEGFRDGPLHQLASMLHDAHPLHSAHDQSRNRS